MPASQLHCQTLQAVDRHPELPLQVSHLNRLPAVAGRGGIVSRHNIRSHRLPFKDEKNDILKKPLYNLPQLQMNELKSLNRERKERDMKSSAKYAFTFLIMAAGYLSGWFKIQETEAAFTKLPNPTGLPTGHGHSSSFSPDMNYLAVAHMNEPFVTIYKRSGDMFTKLANPSVLPAGNGFGAAFSPDGAYLAVAHDVSPYVTIYKHDGDKFAKLANPDVLPISVGRKVRFVTTAGGTTYMAVAHKRYPYITIYKRNGDTFTKLADPEVLPTGYGYGASFSPDGIYLVIAHDKAPFVTIYYRSGDTFTKLANPDILPTNVGCGPSFTPDGTYLAVGHDDYPFLTIYKVDPTHPTTIPSFPSASLSPSHLPAVAGRGRLGMGWLFFGAVLTHQATLDERRGREQGRGFTTPRILDRHRGACCVL